MKLQWQVRVSKAATDTIIAMTELWRIEDEVRGRDADSRSMLRREKGLVANLSVGRHYSMIGRIFMLC